MKYYSLIIDGNIKHKIHDEVEALRRVNLAFKDKMNFNSIEEANEVLALYNCKLVEMNPDNFLKEVNKIEHEL